MRHGREANLYVLGSKGVINVGREVFGEQGPDGTVDCLGQLGVARSRCVSWLQYVGLYFYIHFIILCLFVGKLTLLTLCSSVCISAFR